MIRPYHAKWKVHYGPSRHHFSVQALWKNRGSLSGGNPILALAIGANQQSHSGQFDPASATPVRETRMARVDLSPNGAVIKRSFRFRTYRTREQRPTLSAIAALANWGAKLRIRGSRKVAGVRIRKRFRDAGCSGSGGRTRSLRWSCRQPANRRSGARSVARRFGGDRAIRGRAILLNGDA